LGRERFQPAVCQVDVFRQALFELDTPALLLAMVDGAFENGPVGTHVGADYT
jgi:hypothetical protein